MHSIVCLHVAKSGASRLGVSVRVRAEFSSALLHAALCAHGSGDEGLLVVVKDGLESRRSSGGGQAAADGGGKKGLDWRDAGGFS